MTEMLRKFTICGAMIFISPGTMTQLCFSIVTGAFFLSLHFKFQPFDDDLDDNLQTAALLASFLTLVTTVLIRANEGGGMTSLFIMFVNLGVLATAIYGLVEDVIPSLIEEYTDQYDELVSIKETLEHAVNEFNDLAALANLREEAAAPAMAVAIDETTKETAKTSDSAAPAKKAKTAKKGPAAAAADSAPKVEKSEPEPAGAAA